jgi:hypothetical protein
MLNRLDFNLSLNHEPNEVRDSSDLKGFDGTGSDSKVMERY